MPRPSLIVGIAVLMIASLAAVASGDPPRPGTTNSSLTESEEATLWSKLPAEGYVTAEEYYAAYGENRTTTHDVANGSDLSFTEPPATADRWTEYAHGTFEPGDQDTSRYPAGATTESGWFIKDAHVTLFAVSPSTTTYVAPDETRFYVPPEGTILGIVDYRIEVPATTRLNHTDITWELDSHRITETRLYVDGDEVASAPGGHHPVHEYDVDDAEEITIEADIEARLIREEASSPVNRTREVRTETVTVSDTLAVDFYDLTATAYVAAYPTGVDGVSIYQSVPWRGYTLDAEGRHEIGGVWRFFTARDTDWDRLVESTSDDTTRIDNDALPVFVHAYPSDLGPRAKPEYGGPTIDRTWGEDRETPAESLPANVTVEVVNESYTPTEGLAVESRALDRDALTVHGIVRGTEATIPESIDVEERPPRESELTAAIIAENETGVTVLLTLADAETGSPIVLEGGDRLEPIGEIEREGYIEIDDRRVKTNSTGHAVIHLTEQGVYTARYEPASWMDSQPVYTGNTAMVRWHSLLTFHGWVDLLVRFMVVLSPFVVMWYAGHRLGSMFRWSEYP